MGTLKTFLDSKSITPTQLVTTSNRIESRDSAGRTMMVKRVAKRKDKENGAKKYADLNLTKVAELGRGVSPAQVAAAIEDKPVTKKVRTKIFRAVNAMISKKGGPVEFKALFEGTTAKPGKKAKDEKKKV